jgi:hypothetical protein
VIRALDTPWAQRSASSFCLLENGASEELARRGQSRPVIAVITGDAEALAHRLL